MRSKLKLPFFRGWSGRSFLKADFYETFLAPGIICSKELFSPFEMQMPRRHTKKISKYTPRCSEKINFWRPCNLVIWYDLKGTFGLKWGASGENQNYLFLYVGFTWCMQSFIKVGRWGWDRQTDRQTFYIFRTSLYCNKRMFYRPISSFFLDITKLNLAFLILAINDFLMTCN